MNLEEKFRLIQESDPILRFCKCFDDTSEIWNFQRHSHPYIELMYFLNGKGNLEVSDHRMSISLFDTVLYPAKWEHQEEAVSEEHRRVICLWIEIPELDHIHPLKLHDIDNTLYYLFKMIYREATKKKPEPFLLKYEIKLLLTSLFKMQEEVLERQSCLSDALQYIHANYAEPIALGKLAELEHISKSYLERQFHKLTGMTVVEYINQLRIKKAKHYLISTSDKVNQIAIDVGFNSPKYFYRVFHKLTGESPAVFRRRYKKFKELD